MSEKCPICLDRNEDYGNCNMCYKCGSFFCEICKLDMSRNGIRTCPCCRQVYAQSRTDVIDSLKFLKKRKEKLPQWKMDFIDACLASHYYTQRINLEETRVLLEGPAKRGFFGSMSLLGIMYREGIGGKKDYQKAIRYLTKTCFIKDSVLSLIEMYQKGQGVKRDPEYAEILRKIYKNNTYNYIHCKTGKPLI